MLIPCISLYRARSWFVAGTSLLLLCVLAFAVPPAHAQRADQGEKGWADYGGSPSNSHYADIKQITKDNVNRLRVAWTYSTHNNATCAFNPVMVHGIAYVLTHNSSLVAPVRRP